MTTPPKPDFIAALQTLLERPGRPYHAFRSELYTPEELYNRFDPARPDSYRGCMDWQTFVSYIQVDADQQPLRPQRYVSVGLDEKVARRLHDHFIVKELNDFLERATPPNGRGVVAIMGGHDEPRDPKGRYRTIAHMARELAAEGFLIATGGGPGLMEAANLGARLAHNDATMLDQVIGALSRSPRYNDPGWLRDAWIVRAGLPPDPTENLGVPTWFYGHEPPNVFATHIAKYFENSLREEGLLALATHGVVFAPGNAGTVQEIFQDGCQNYYATYGYSSPMILFDADYWNPPAGALAGKAKPVWPLLQALAEEKGIGPLISLTSSVDDVKRQIRNFVPPS